MQDVRADWIKQNESLMENFHTQNQKLIET